MCGATAARLRASRSEPPPGNGCGSSVLVLPLLQQHNFAAWLHGGPALPRALSLTPAACRATCLATTVKQEGKTAALLALSYSLTQPCQWGRAPRSLLSVRPRKHGFLPQNGQAVIMDLCPQEICLTTERCPRQPPSLALLHAGEAIPEDAPNKPKPCQAAYSGPMAPAQQVLHFYQHLARVTSIYVEQVPKAKILPPVCHVIRPVTTAAGGEIPLRLQPPPHGHNSSSGKKLNFILIAPSNPQSPEDLNLCAWWMLAFSRYPGTRQTAVHPRDTCLTQGMQYNSTKTPRSTSPYPWFVFLCLLISFSPSMIH